MTNLAFMVWKQQIRSEFPKENEIECNQQKRKK